MFFSFLHHIQRSVSVVIVLFFVFVSFLISVRTVSASAIYFQDDLDEGSNVVLSSHAPDVGTSWSQLINNGRTLWVYSYNNHATTQSNGNDVGTLYQANGTYSSADYEITATISFAGGDWSYSRSLAVRIQDANNMYLLRQTWGSQGFQIYKRVSGTWTLLGSAAVYVSGNTNYPYKGDTFGLRAEGDQISALHNGSVVLTVTDNSITQAGKAGIGTGYVNVSTDDSGTGVGIDDVTVQDLVDDVAPTITSVSSDKANGSYKAGDVIDIDVTFSEAVTSTGNVTVTLETGDIDRTCTFTVTNASTGTCNYTVQEGDTSGDLNVSSISGTIADQASNAMVNFTPSTNLASNKALVIDTSGSTLSSIVATPSDNTASITWTTDELSSSLVEYGLNSSYGSTTAEADTSPRVTSHTVNLSSLSSCAKYYYRVKSSDGAGNQTVSIQKSFFTTGCTVSSIQSGSDANILTSGGNVNISHSNSTASITAPNGFYSEPADFQINLLDSTSIPTAPTGTSLIDNNFFDLLAVADSGSQINTFLTNVSFMVNYGSNIENTYDENTLDIYKYSAGEWSKKNCSVNTSANTITCALGGFSVYGVFGQTRTDSTTVTSSNTTSTTPSTSDGTCNRQRPHDIPDLFQIDTRVDSATLYFVPASSNVTGYVIEYGETQEAGQHAVSFDHPDTSGAVPFTINLLSSNKTWYFKVQAKNDCVGGDWSAVKSAYVGQQVLAEEVEETSLISEDLTGVEVATDSAEISQIEEKKYTVSVAVRQGNQPLSGIKLKLSEYDQEVTTNDEGLAVFETVGAGQKNLKIVNQAYAAEKSFEVAGDNQNFDVVLYVDVNKPLLPTEVWIGIIGLVVVGGWIWIKWRG